VLAADETPVNVLDQKRRAVGCATGRGRRGSWLQALASRRKGDVAARIPAALTGFLMMDDYTG